MKKILILVLFGIGLGFLLFLSHLQRTFWSVLVLNEIYHFESHGWLSRWSEPPKSSSIAFHGPLGAVKADLYEPSFGKARAGVLLNHGVIDTGKDDPRLKRLAEILSGRLEAFFVGQPTYDIPISIRLKSLTEKENRNILMHPFLSVDIGYDIPPSFPLQME